MHSSKVSDPLMPGNGLPPVNRTYAPILSTSPRHNASMPSAPVDDVASLLCSKLVAYMAAARAATAERLGLTLQEVKALELVREFDSLPTGQLGQLLGISSGGTTALINRLEVSGFIQRTRHPLDRRAIVIRAVPERFPELDEGQASLVEEIAFVSRQFDTQQLQTVCAFLNQCARAFRQDALTRLQARHALGLDE